MIRFYGDSMQMLVPRFLEQSMSSLTKEQGKFREQMAQAFGVGLSEYIALGDWRLFFLSRDQLAWRGGWRGAPPVIVRTPAEALAAIGATP